MEELLETDVLIIGSGIGGSTTALQLADSGLRITLVTRSKGPSESNTYQAQGGIIYTGEGDSPELLAEDILRAGANYCNPRAVKILAEEGPPLVREFLIEKMGVDFDHNEDGQLSLVREGGHSVPRILHKADATGRAIAGALNRALFSHADIQVFTNQTAIDLLTPSHHAINRLSIYDPLSCVGAYVLDRDSGKVWCCLARKIVLATGGLGQIYLHTTNPPGARGDGLAMAFRAGARAINNEFIQFHPTAFYQIGAPRLLITEAVRGAGALLVNQDGEPFMQRYAPEWKDLAPRDIVARSIYQEMLLRDEPNMLLDLRSHIPADQIRQQFPTIYQSLLGYGVDITTDLIPIAPAAHYACGGVWADEWGRTTIEDLYAVGEVACTGVHGANRLASTSLLEALTWGHRAARHILGTIGDASLHDASDIPPWEETGREEADPAIISQFMSSIKHIMWNYVGLIRSTSRLEAALRELRNLGSHIEKLYQSSRVTDGLLGLGNALRAASIVARDAWTNKKSIGCHYRV
jgi:L-aspartate oxidase